MANSVKRPTKPPERAHKPSDYGIDIGIIDKREALSADHRRKSEMPWTMWLVLDDGDKRTRAEVLAERVRFLVGKGLWLCAQSAIQEAEAAEQDIATGNPHEVSLVDICPQYAMQIDMLARVEIFTASDVLFHNGESVDVPRFKPVKLAPIIREIERFLKWHEAQKRKI